MPQDDVVALRYLDGPENPPVCDSASVLAAYDSSGIGADFMTRSLIERRAGLVGARNKNTVAAPLYQYKYRSLDLSNNREIEKARALLVHSRIWAATPSSLNDPHDLNFVVKENPDKAAKRRWIKQNAHLLPPMPPARRLLLMRKLEGQKMTEKMIAGFRADVDQRTGVFCASACPRDILMWTHYAASSRGFCVQISTFRDELFLLSKRVDYSDHYPTITIPSDPTSQDEYYLRKSPVWAYEREWRVVVPLNRCLISLRPEAISAVIFGTKAERALIDAVLGMLAERNALGLPPMNTYKAHLPVGSYGIKLARLL